MQTALYAILLLAAMAVCIGLVLSWASQRFHVDVNPKIENIEEILPNINCGACGFPGCNGFATGLVEGKAEPSGCPPGGQPVAVKVATILGLPMPEPSEERPVVRIKCTGEGAGVVAYNYEYHGLDDCNASYVLYGGNKGCQWGCMGLGSCVKVCPYDAFDWTHGLIPKVIDDKCTGCSLCIPSCPVDLIEMYTDRTEVIVLCNSLDKAKTTAEVCQVGCISCDKCVKACPYEAVEVENFLAVITQDKCTGCGLCVEACPTDCIIEQPREEKAVINEDCTGCLACKLACPTDAISGEQGELHTVNAAACIGCDMCVGICPPGVDALSMVKPADIVPLQRAFFWDHQNTPEVTPEPASA